MAEQNPANFSSHQCTYFDKGFNSKHGLKKYVSKIHSVIIHGNISCKDSSDTNLPDVSTVIPSKLDNTPDNQISDTTSFHQSLSPVICSICKNHFHSDRGLNVHIAKRHPIEMNRKRVLRLTSSTLSDEHIKNDLDVVDSTIEKAVDSWYKRFNQLKQSISETNFSCEKFDKLIKDFLDFLLESNNQLPGPKNPAIRFYRSRKKRQNMGSVALQLVKNSNPQRVNKQARMRRKEQYNYELAQYNYYNRRKKVANAIFNCDTTKRPCKIKIDSLEDHFSSLFGEPNNRLLDEYPVNFAQPDISISLEVVHKAIKQISIDTAPGSDQVLMRTIKELKIAHIIKSIIDIMLLTSHVPTKLKEGRTILIDKGGDETEINNWRPITIYSVLRRIIEKVLVINLRWQVNLNPNQRGFAPGIPGCMINSKIINAVLKDAKLRRRNCLVAFLDISRAFDNVGHNHIEKSLKSMGVSQNLLSLILNLLKDNFTSLMVNNKKSNQIKVNRGVPQGGPLSPILFNIAINFIYQEMCDEKYVRKFGYKLADHKICLTGFADDQALTCPDVITATRSIELCQFLFSKIGLSINSKKSCIINISKGSLRHEDIVTNCGTIRAIAAGERIRYLGCSISDEVIFDKDVLTKFNKNLENLIVSPLLKPDQNCL